MHWSLVAFSSRILIYLSQSEWIKRLLASQPSVLIRYTCPGEGVAAVVVARAQRGAEEMRLRRMESGKRSSDCFFGVSRVHGDAANAHQYQCTEQKKS